MGLKCGIVGLQMCIRDRGMSEKLGPLTFGKKEEEIFLGREISQHRDYSEDTAIIIDEEVRTCLLYTSRCV